jgi:hypothetical protein
MRKSLEFLAFLRQMRKQFIDDILSMNYRGDQRKKRERNLLDSGSLHCIQCPDKASEMLLKMPN